MDSRLAHPEETNRVAELVTAAGLPTAGLAQAWRTWVAVDRNRLLAPPPWSTTAAPTCCARSRSATRRAAAASAPSWSAPPSPRSTQPGRWRALLTETAAGWFPRFGFHPVDRAALDPALATSAELAGACPATAQAFLRPARWLGP